MPVLACYSSVRAQSKMFTISGLFPQLDNTYLWLAFLQNGFKMAYYTEESYMWKHLEKYQEWWEYKYESFLCYSTIQQKHLLIAHYK